MLAPKCTDRMSRSCWRPRAGESSRKTLCSTSCADTTGPGTLPKRSPLPKRWRPTFTRGYRRRRSTVRPRLSEMSDFDLAAAGGGRCTSTGWPRERVSVGNPERVGLAMRITRHVLLHGLRAAALQECDRRRIGANRRLKKAPRRSANSRNGFAATATISPAAFECPIELKSGALTETQSRISGRSIGGVIIRCKRLLRFCDGALYPHMVSPGPRPPLSPIRRLPCIYARVVRGHGRRVPLRTGLIKISGLPSVRALIRLDTGCAAVWPQRDWTNKCLAGFVRSGDR